MTSGSLKVPLRAQGIAGGEGRRGDQVQQQSKRLGLVADGQPGAGPRSYSLGWWRMQHRMERTFTPKSRSPSCRPWHTRATTSSGVRSPLCGERSRVGPETKESLKKRPGTEEGEEERGGDKGRGR